MTALVTGAALLVGLAAAGFGPGVSQAEAQMVNVRGRAMYGQTRLRPGFMPDPAISRGMAGGPIAGSSINPRCRGYYAPNPSHIVAARGGFRQLRFVVSAPQDTTLMVMLPNGQVLCDDDSGESNNPLVATASPPGRIAVWVGTYTSSRAGQVPYTLGLSELPHVTASSLMGGGVVQQPGGTPMPPVMQGLQAAGPPSFGQLNLSRGFMPDPQVMQGMAGGPIQATQVNSRCRGFLSPNPSHVLFSPTGFQNLRLVGSSSVDTTLVVMLPNGQLVCDDDSGGGSNPLVQLSSPPGRIAIWVGTYSSAQAGRAPYQLGVTEYPHINASNLNNPGVQRPNTGVTVVQPGQPQLPPGMQPNARPSHGAFGLNRGFLPDPHTATGNHGGPVTASRLRGSGACRGYLASAPNHLIASRSGFPQLRILVNAPQDTTLVVMDPQGQIYCDDDGGQGNNPMVVMNNVAPGAIRVWVGSYSRSAIGGPYTIGFSELPNVTAANLGGTGVTVVPPGGNRPNTGVTVVPPGGNPGVGGMVQGLIGEAVQMTARIPVTLMGPGMTTPTVAAWRPRGGPEVRVGVPPGAQGTIPLLAQYNNQTTTLEQVPAAMVQGGVLTATQIRGGDLVLRAELAPSPGNQGQIMILRLRWNGSQPEVADRWRGDFRRRPPRWAR